MEYIKFHTDFLDDPKILSLSDAAQLLFVKLMLLARRNRSDGCTGHTPEEAMLSLRMHHKTFNAALKQLLDSGLVSLDDALINGQDSVNNCSRNFKERSRIFIKNFKKRQGSGDNSTERSRKHRLLKSNATLQQRDATPLERERERERDATVVTNVTPVAAPPSPPSVASLEPEPTLPPPTPIDDHPIFAPFTAMAPDAKFGVEEAEIACAKPVTQTTDAEVYAVDREWVKFRAYYVSRPHITSRNWLINWEKWIARTNEPELQAGRAAAIAKARGGAA